MAILIQVLVGTELEQFANLMTDKNGPIFWMLVDSVDVLTPHNRHRLWIILEQLISKYPRHKYVVTYNTNLSELPLKLGRQSGYRGEFTWGSEVEFLVIQPLSSRTVEWFLMT